MSRSAWRVGRAVGAGAVGAGAVGAVLALALGGCSSSGSDGATSGSTSAAEATTTVPATWTAEVTGEVDVDGNFRQGLARSGDGWLFVTNNAIYRTDADFQQTDEHLEAIPDELAAQGYDHLGDPDVHDGLIWIPVERDDKDGGTQVTARYDEATLEFVDSVEVAQHHNSFIGVDDDGVAYSTDEFSDDAIVRYRIEDGEVVALDPIELDRTVERIQGGDLIEGALWLSTDDDRNGVYRVDLDTGAVTEVGAATHVEGEGEGIDATDLDGSQLRVLVADEAIAPMWVVALALSS